jgi:hypothetical protein
MSAFLDRFASSIHGVLSGFDRIRFRGTQRLLASVRGLGAFLSLSHVRLTEFKPYVTAVTDRIRHAVETQAREAGVAVTYLNDSSLSKEEVAADLAKRAGRTTGLRAILSAVEPCRTFFVRKNPATGFIELQNRLGKCLHYYHYWHDATLGPCHVRLQTWFPFNVFVCVNGRDMLAGELMRQGIAFRKRDNCFSWVSDLERAQQLLDAQVRLDWSAELTRLLTASHPDWPQWPGMDRAPYWSADQTEWATDVLFRSRAELSRLMPSLIQHALIGLGCGNVMRFLGRHVPGTGEVHARFAGEVGTDYVKRPEGARVAFRVNRNAVKFYDKQGSVFRVETTITDARDLKSFRAKESDPEGPKRWLPMKKGVSDLPRRAEVSQKSNERCLEALAATKTERTVGELTAEVCERTKWKGRPVRALNPLAADDLCLLRTVGRGEFVFNGLRNRDVRAALYGPAPDDAAEGKRQSAAVTRLLRLLRAHGVIQKIAKTHRYKVTTTGRELIAALTIAHAAQPQTLQNTAKAA